MFDLIVGCVCIGVATAGLISVGYALCQHDYASKRATIARYLESAQVSREAVPCTGDSAITALHAELTRCTGAMMHCARRGDRRGARHAHRAMKPILRELEAAERSRRGGKSGD